MPDSQDPLRLLRRISGLNTERWQDHFSSISQDAILGNVNDRVLHYWGSDGFYRIYPTSVPLTEEMTRRGRTTVTLKRPDPDWRPTATMLARNPDLPTYVPPGPGQPARHPRAQPRLAVLPHPRHQRHPQDRPAVVRGCIGLFNEHILEVYDRAQIGTPVLLIDPASARPRRERSCARRAPPADGLGGLERVAPSANRGVAI